MDREAKLCEVKGKKGMDGKRRAGQGGAEWPGPGLGWEGGCVFTYRIIAFNGTTKPAK